MKGLEVRGEDSRSLKGHGLKNLVVDVVRYSRSQDGFFGLVTGFSLVDRFRYVV